MDGCVMLCRIVISSCQSAATSDIVKAPLDTSLTHESGDVASTGQFLTFTFRWSLLFPFGACKVNIIIYQMF